MISWIKHLVNKKISIVTDSDYSIKCATSYGEKCAKQHWNKNIPNKNLVKQLYTIYKTNPNLKKKVKLKNKNNSKSKTEVKILFFKSLGIKYYQNFFLYSYIF